MIREKILRIIFIALTVFWMAFIFYCSAKPADESTEMSNEIDYIICRIFVSDFNLLSPEKQEALALGLDHTVRKTAHGLEYTALGFLIFSSLYMKDKNKIKTLLICILIGILYAASDELHQLFVEGRAGKFTDVLIDSGGIIVGNLVALLIIPKFIFRSDT